MSDRCSDRDLLARYIVAFGKLDDLDGPDQYGYQQSQPQHFMTAPSSLASLYQGLGLPGEGSTRFPSLYEHLLLSYRWPEVDLGSYRLMANEPADDLSPLLAVMQADKHLRATLVPNGYIQFARGPDIDYDPVCFDLRHQQRNGDCRIVRLDHEAILCHYRIQEVAELAPNFRSLVLDTIHRTASVQAS